MQADLVVINKMILLLCWADLDLIRKEAAERRQGMIAYTNYKTGSGLDQVVNLS